MEGQLIINMDKKEMVTSINSNFIQKKVKIEPISEDDSFSDQKSQETRKFRKAIYKKWGNQQRIRYMIFLKKCRQLSEPLKQRQNLSWYKKMSKSVGDCNVQGCKKYHSSYLKKYGSIQGIIDYLKQNLSFNYEKLEAETNRIHQVLKQLKQQAINKLNSLSKEISSDIIFESSNDVFVTAELQNKVNLKRLFEDLEKSSQNSSQIQIQIPLQTLLVIEKFLETKSLNRSSGYELDKHKFWSSDELKKLILFLNFKKQLRTKVNRKIYEQMKEYINTAKTTLDCSRKISHLKDKYENSMQKMILQQTKRLEISEAFIQKQKQKYIAYKNSNLQCKIEVQKLAIQGEFKQKEEIIEKILNTKIQVNFCFQLQDSKLKSDLKKQEAPLQQIFQSLTTQAAQGQKPQRADQQSATFISSKEELKSVVRIQIPEKKFQIFRNKKCQFLKTSKYLINLKIQFL